MIVFNSQLLKQLVDMLNTNYTRMSEHTSCSHDTVKRCLSRGDVRFDTFIELCNAYRLNIHCFFYTYGEPAPCSKVIVPKKRWQQLEFLPDLITNYHNKPETIWCSDVAKWMSDNEAELPVSGNTNSPTIKEDVNAEPGSTSPSKDLEEESRSTPYIFNMQMFSTLPTALGVGRSEIGYACGRQSNMYTIAVQHRDVRMRALVDICNKYHVDIRLFFSREEYVPMNVIIPEDKWTPITFHPERLTDFVGNREQHKLLDKLNYSKQRFYRTTDPDNSPMMACEFSNVLNVLHVEPGYFFDAPEMVSDQRIARELNNRINNQQELIDRLNTEKRRLESQLRHEKAMNSIGKKS